jgi:hypothetical protein
VTIYCYDTEFLEDGKTVDLISIGIVCEDGREYYAVNSEADWDRIRKDDWMMDNVVRHLPTHRTGEVQKRKGFGESGWSWGGIHMRDARVKPKWVIANEVRDFLLTSVVPAQPSQIDRQDGIPAHGFPELWAYFAAYDHVALAQLWGKMLHLPKGIPMYTHDIKQEMDRLSVPSSAVPKPQNQHDALADARWNMDMLTELRRREAGA